MRTVKVLALTLLMTGCGGGGKFPASYMERDPKFFARYRKSPSFNTGYTGVAHANLRRQYDASYQRQVESYHRRNEANGPSSLNRYPTYAPYSPPY